ncbi:MAG: hypothetical protein ABSG13_09815 [Bryobacteraceae bacterium]|jgi:hypothetical protein
MFKTLSIAAVLVGLAASLSAQVIDPDTLKVSYFSNNGPAPDNTVRLTNVGTSGGNVCADIYVFDVDQELAECCSCRQTPDGLGTLSVYGDLTSNTLTGVPLPSGAIKIVSSSTCNAVSPKPAAGIRAWATHVQNNGQVTETDFQDSGLSAVELSRLAAECAAIALDGSGKGICTCGTGD